MDSKGAKMAQLARRLPPTLPCPAIRAADKRCSQLKLAGCAVLSSRATLRRTSHQTASSLPVCSPASRPGRHAARGRRPRPCPASTHLFPFLFFSRPRFTDPLSPSRCPARSSVRFCPLRPILSVLCPLPPLFPLSFPSSLFSLIHHVRSVSFCPLSSILS